MKLYFRLKNLFCRPCVMTQVTPHEETPSAKKDRDISIESHALRNAVSVMQAEAAEIRKKADALLRLASMR